VATWERTDELARIDRSVPLLVLIESLNVALESFRRLIQLDDLRLNLATAEIVNAGHLQVNCLCVFSHPMLFGVLRWQFWQVMSMA